MKAEDSNQKQYRKHDDQQNKNKQKTKMEKKQLYRRFMRPKSDISHEKTWTWLKKETSKEKLILF